MKKVLLTLMLALCAMSMFAVTQFPGWKCTDISKIDTAITELTKENKLVGVRQIECIKFLAINKNATFNDFVKFVDTIKYPETWNPINKKKSNIKLIKQVSLCRSQFQNEVLEFCKKNPTEYDVYFVLSRWKQLKLSETERYDFLVNSIFNYTSLYSNRDKIRIIEKIIELADGQDPVKVKKDLQRLNRKFSKNLLKEKATWEPVIAEIRTVLETY